MIISDYYVASLLMKVIVAFHLLPPQR